VEVVENFYYNKIMGIGGKKSDSVQPSCFEKVVVAVCYGEGGLVDIDGGD
jgi:hypothetical protein